jgi:hypothetical protein
MTQLSNCCNAIMLTRSSIEGTSYWECALCHKSCNPRVPDVSKTCTSGTNYFDLPEEEQHRLVKEAGKKAQKMQQAVESKVSDTLQTSSSATLNDIDVPKTPVYEGYCMYCLRDDKTPVERESSETRQTGWEDRFDEEFPGDVIVMMEDGMHAMITSHYYVRLRLLSFIRHEIQEAEKRTAKAYGGCTNCYGKGYRTKLDFTTGYDDFKTEGFKIQNASYESCSHCERGKQIEKLLGEAEKRHTIKVLEGLKWCELGNPTDILPSISRRTINDKLTQAIEEEKA